MFSLTGFTDDYRLNVFGYTGTAGDSFSSSFNSYGNHRGVPQNGMKFTTFDKDNDVRDGYNCAKIHHGAWWYGKCSMANADLNSGDPGKWNWKTYYDRANSSVTDHTATTAFYAQGTEIKVRPRA